jgi:hypothetical protein
MPGSSTWDAAWATSTFLGGAIFGFAGEAQGKRIDVVAFTLRHFALQRLRLLDVIQCFRLFLRRHRRVDVRSQHQRLSPIGHGRVRIKPCRFSKGARRLGVIETISEIQALIDEALGLLGIRRHREGVFTDVLQSRCDGA